MVDGSSRVGRSRKILLPLVAPASSRPPCSSSSRAGTSFIFAYVLLNDQSKLDDHRLALGLLRHEPADRMGRVMAGSILAAIRS